MGEGSTNRDNDLFHEYKAMIDLFISENRTAWELVSIYIALQAGLLSAFALVFVQQTQHVKTIAYLIISLTGAISSGAWAMMQSRSRMWRSNWLLAGLQIERTLSAKGRISDLNFAVFGIEHHVRECREALTIQPRMLFEGKIEYRDQEWCERAGALRFPHYAMYILTFIWLCIFLYELLIKFLRIC